MYLFTMWIISLILVQGYDTPQNWDEGSHDPSYYSQEYGHDGRSSRGGFTGGDGIGRGGFHNNKKRIVPSEPSPHVIFLGLDPDFTEADVRCIPLYFVIYH